MEVAIAMHVGSAYPSDWSFVGRLVDEREKFRVDGMCFAEMSEDMCDFSVSEFES